MLLQANTKALKKALTQASKAKSRTDDGFGYKVKLSATSEMLSATVCNGEMAVIMPIRTNDEHIPWVADTPSVDHKLVMQVARMYAPATV